MKPVIIHPTHSRSVRPVTRDDLEEGTTILVATATNVEVINHDLKPQTWVQYAKTDYEHDSLCGAVLSETTEADWISPQIYYVADVAHAAGYDRVFFTTWLSENVEEHDVNTFDPLEPYVPTLRLQMLTVRGFLNRVNRCWINERADGAWVENFVFPHWREGYRRQIVGED